MKRINPAIVAVSFLAVVFIVGLVFFGWRDVRATDRCEAMGGQTWDSGEHCVLGDPEVINTRGGVWGQ